MLCITCYAHSPHFCAPHTHTHARHIYIDTMIRWYGDSSVHIMISHVNIYRIFLLQRRSLLCVCVRCVHMNKLNNDNVDRSTTWSYSVDWLAPHVCATHAFAATRVDFCMRLDRSQYSPWQYRANSNFDACTTIDFVTVLSRSQDEIICRESSDFSIIGSKVGFPGRCVVRSTPEICFVLSISYRFSFLFFFSIVHTDTQSPN